MATATILVCPNCDSTLERTTKKCDYCHQPVIVDSGSLVKMQDDQVKKYVKSYNQMLTDGKGTSGEMESYIAMCASCVCTSTTRLLSTSTRPLTRASTTPRPTL